VFNRRLVGRPVAVLSNNDGCCVARSNEFKALGIPMGTPYFQLKAREATGELSFCSSNDEYVWGQSLGWRRLFPK
jgi:DNA polymerase V